MSTVLEKLATSEYGCGGADLATRRLRLCHLSVGLATGGLERLLVDFARFHDGDQFEVTFAAMQNEGRPAQEIRELDCVVHALHGKGKGRLKILRELSELFRAEKIDIVHTHNAVPHFYGTLAARWAGVPVVVHTRHGQRFGHGWKSALQYRLAAYGVDRIVAVSDDAALLSCREDRLPAAKVQRIWNGIDMDRFNFRGPSTRPVAISVARLSREKDFPTLLHAVPQVIREIPEFRLQIVGDGAERPALEQLVHELNLSGCVELLGERSDIPELLAGAGFFVSSSRTEGVSLTLLEAMAVGLPILATTVGGNPEVVVDGVTGRLVPAADPQALAAGMIDMCKHATEWPTQGAMGRQRVADHFDIRRMLRDYEALYQQLMTPHL